MGRPMPYQPMRETPKMVSRETMWATLAKHVPGAKPPEEPKPPTVAEVEIPELTWLKPESKYCVRTKCGRYSCSKVIICGRATYELWALDPSGSWFSHIAVGLESFDEAKKHAQIHLRKRLTGK